MAMTVLELIAALSEENPDAVVYIAGCDCYGVAGSVVGEKDGSVSIERTEETQGGDRRPGL